MAVIDGYRTKHPATPFTTENIQPLGVSESIAPRTLQALRLLDLVGDSGDPTPAMNVLRDASNAEFPERLAEVVRAGYQEVFNYKDPATDSPDELIWRRVCQVAAGDRGRRAAWVVRVGRCGGAPGSVSASPV
jgi:hypothetical protein